MLDKKEIRKKARSCYANQRTRCYNPNSSTYRFYGPKNIEVEYTRESFYYWFEAEVIRLGISDLRPLSIGRIDHEKSYSFDNIKIETRSENSKERIRRLPMPSMFLYAVRDDETIVFRSCGSAARFFGMKRASILRSSLKKNKTPAIRNGYALYNREQFYSL